MSEIPKINEPSWYVVLKFLLLTCFLINLLIIAGCAGGNGGEREALTVYHDECYSSHQEKDVIIDYTNYTPIYYDLNGVLVYRGEAVYNYTTICDKYVLVRDEK